MLGRPAHLADTLWHRHISGDERDEMDMTKMKQIRSLLLAAMMAMTTAGIAAPAQAQSNEPWLPPTYQSPPNLSQLAPIPSAPGPHAAVTSPPPMYVPRTGQVLPNLPIVAGSGSDGRETFQDRAARCAHQAGTYGQLAGDRGQYIGACVSQ
jgi:hypothetical protein